MMSPLIRKLDAELQGATDPQRRVELIARKACVLARQGRHGDAAEHVRNLRAAHGDWSSAVTHSWIMLAEGLNTWFSELSAVGLDRIVRAQLLSTAARSANLIAISSAWRAHIEFERSDFPAMFRSLQVALGQATDDNLEAHGRIATVVFNLLSLTGEIGRAKDWFGRAHRLAVTEGDQASIEALQYNRAVLGVTWARVSYFIGQLDPQVLQMIRYEFESSRNYQALTKFETLAQYFVLCDARLLMLEGKFLAAVSLLEQVRGSAMFAANHCSECLLDLEIAHCLQKLGDDPASLKAFQRADMSQLVDLDIDDRLVATCIAHKLSSANCQFGDPTPIDLQRKMLQESYIENREALVKGVEALKPKFVVR